MKLTKTTKAAALPIALTLMVAGCGGSDDSPIQGAKPSALSCEQMLEQTVASAHIGLPTQGAKVTAALSVPASGEGVAAVSEHCLVTGEIAPVDPAAPSIRFQLALPTQWNQKLLMLGGGGLDGLIPNVVGNVPAGPVDAALPLARGYAVFGSDSGHQAGPLASLDASFGLNDEALNNYNTGDALKKTRDVATALIKARYAQEHSRAYFAGGSTGGREALTAIQRWPADWDGAIAWYPARAGMVSILGGHRMSRALAQPGAYPNAAKREALFKAAVQACDGFDGAMDGIISHQDRCNAIFDPATALVDGAPLRCPAGADTGDHCLSDAQITAMNVINTPTRLDYLASGETQHPGYNIWGADTGIYTWKTPVQPVVDFLAFNRSAPTLPMPADAPYISIYTDQWIKYHVTRDPHYNSLSLDPENPGAWASRISLLSTGLDAKTDLSGFAAKGGKLLMAHGLNDVLVSSRSTRDYYNILVAQMGAQAVHQFARYYEVPGRTRPLCDYPQWPQYQGSGDVNAAASFTCAP